MSTNTLGEQVAATPSAGSDLNPNGRHFTQKTSKAVALTGGAVTVVLASAMIFAPIVDEAVAGLSVLLLLVLLFLRIPVAVSMGIAGLIGIFAVSGGRSSAQALIDLPFSGAASWSLSVIPMFVFMGLLLWRCGATTRIYDASRAWFGRVPGGLAMTTNLSGAGLAAATGSTIGIAYALGRIGIPEMLRAGYDRRMALGSVIMAGIPGQLIPPSLLLVIYAGVANLPVGPQLLAGILPGIGIAIIVCIAIIVLALIWPGMAPRSTDSTTWREKWQSVYRVWPIPALVVVIMLGLYGGWATATEAAAIGAIGAIVIAGFSLKGRTFLTAVYDALLGTVAAVGSIFFLMIGAAFFNRLVIMSGVPRLFTESVQAWGLSEVQFILAVLVLALILGMFMDPISLMLLSVPMLLPSLALYDINLVWFGVVMVIVAEIGMLTPPVGVLVFVVHKVTQHRDVNLGHTITLGDTFKTAAYCVPLSLLMVGLLMVFPEIATWLVDTSSSRS